VDVSYISFQQLTNSYEVCHITDSFYL